MIVWTAENLMWASAAMLLVLVIRRPAARLFGAGTAYALWLIPLLRLIAPPADWFAGLFTNPMPALPPLLLYLESGSVAAPSPLGGPGQWAPILLAGWAGGALLFLALQAWLYRRFLTRLALSSASAGSHRGVRLVGSAAADGPLALGLLDRRIVVPADFAERYAAEERQLALDHERYHHRRGDILANHVALVVLALNWFNPIAWIAFRAFRADQELSCDAAITASIAPEARADYARALVKSASRPGLVAACPLNGADQLKRRLRMLKHHRKDARRLWAGGAVAATLAAATLLSGVPGHAQNGQPSPKGEPQQRREQIIIMDQRGSGEAAPAPGERREIRIRRHGDGNVTAEGLPPEVEARMENCREGNRLVEVNEGAANQRIRFLLCTQGEATAENRIEALQRARERLSEDTHLNAGTRQRILAEIDRALATARRD